MGDSKKQLKAFPNETQRAMGGVLMLAQLGGMADHVKPFHGVGSGVFEIVERQDKNAYRLVYAVQLGAKLYVLHAFQKKSKTGGKTPQPDVDLIKQRYLAAQELAQHDPGN
ncbi:MAG: type II toxin-antitoxin system RelE/ParE family toxin [Candidatus Competibacteraceae bacterium]